MSEDQQPDSPRDDAGLPPYGGSADTGVVASAGGGGAGAPDVVDVVLAEHHKLEGVFDEVSQLLDAGDREALRLRWGGVVRELVEHEAAGLRVVLPAAEELAGAGAVADVRGRQVQLLARLREQDELTSEAPPEEVRSTVHDVREHLRMVEDVVVPLLRQLPDDERARLAEDLRQVMG